jgi:hypothetical protein
LWLKTARGFSGNDLYQKDIYLNDQILPVDDLTDIPAKLPVHPYLFTICY